MGDGHLTLLFLLDDIKDFTQHLIIFRDLAPHTAHHGHARASLKNLEQSHNYNNQEHQQLYLINITTSSTTPSEPTSSYISL